jgi:hypothetical protein
MTKKQRESGYTVNDPYLRDFLIHYRKIRFDKFHKTPSGGRKDTFVPKYLLNEQMVVLRTFKTRQELESFFDKSGKDLHYRVKAGNKFWVCKDEINCYCFLSTSPFLKGGIP